LKFINCKNYIVFYCKNLLLLLFFFKNKKKKKKKLNILNIQNLYIYIYIHNLIFNKFLNYLKKKKKKKKKKKNFSFIF